MKLSNLVRLRNLLAKDLSAAKIVNETDELISDFNRIHSIPDLASEFKDYTDQSIGKFIAAKNLVQEPINQIQEMLDRVDARIHNVTKDYYSRGYMINGYYGSNSTDVPTERNDRILVIDPETKELVYNRIALYSQWQYPALEIGPGDGEWTSKLVASDPLYLVDVHQEFLDSTLKRFTVEYQLRLRPYLIDRWKDETDLSQLPQGQIGFVFAWNVFNYFPYENLKKYLTQIMAVLRPGGTALFSYNNCERPPCAEYAEIGWMSWMPKSLLVELCQSLGFTITETFDRDEYTSWIEIKKPGILETNKAHQVMGLIKNIE